MKIPHLSHAESVPDPNDCELDILRSYHGDARVNLFLEHTEHVQTSFSDFHSFIESEQGGDLIDPLHKSKVGKIQIRVDMPTKFAHQFQVNVSDKNWRRSLCKSIEQALNPVVPGVNQVFLHSNGVSADELPTSHFVATKSVNASIPKLEAHFNRMVFENGDDHFESKLQLHNQLTTHLALPVHAQKGTEARIAQFCDEIGKRVVDSLSAQFSKIHTEHLMDEEKHHSIEEHMRSQIRSLLNDPSLYNSVHHQYVSSRFADFLRDHTHQDVDGKESHVENMMIDELVSLVQKTIHQGEGIEELQKWDEKKNSIEFALAKVKKYGASAGVCRSDLKHTESRLSVMRRILTNAMRSIGNRNNLFKLVIHGGRLMELHFKRGASSHLRRRAVHKTFGPMRRHAHRGSLTRMAAHGGVSVHPARPILQARKQRMRGHGGPRKVRSCPKLKKLQALRAFWLMQQKARNAQKSSDSSSSSEDEKKKRKAPPKVAKTAKPAKKEGVFIRVRGKDGVVKLVKIGAQQKKEPEKSEDLQELSDLDELDVLSDDEKDELDEDLEDLEDLNELSGEEDLVDLGSPVHPLSDFADHLKRYSNNYMLYKAISKDKSLMASALSSPCCYVSLKCNKECRKENVKKLLSDPAKLRNIGKSMIAVSDSKHDAHKEVVTMRTLSGIPIEVKNDGVVYCSGKPRDSTAQFAKNDEHPVVFVILSKK